MLEPARGAVMVLPGRPTVAKKARTTLQIRVRSTTGRTITACNPPVRETRNGPATRTGLMSSLTATCRSDVARAHRLPGDDGEAVPRR